MKTTKTKTKKLTVAERNRLNMCTALNGGTRIAIELRKSRDKANDSTSYTARRVDENKEWQDRNERLSYTAGGYGYNKEAAALGDALRDIVPIAVSEKGINYAIGHLRNNGYDAYILETSGVRGGYAKTKVYISKIT